MAVVSSQSIQGTRPAIQARSWAVVSAHPLATLAGSKVLLAGGNAVDAAVAVAAAVGVVEPFESNFLGGESYVLFWQEKERRLLAIEATGYAPSSASLEHYKAIGGIPFYGPKAVIVPGSFDGWCLLLADHGTLRLCDVLAPAVELAQGFPVSRRLNRLMTQFREELLRLPSSANVFLKNGNAYEVGDLIVQKDFAETLSEMISQECKTSDRLSGIRAARDWVYRGGLASQWCQFIKSEGGFITEEDLADYKARYVNPISSSYRGLNVYTAPPPSQGIVLLETLNTLEGYDLRNFGFGSDQAIHLAVEALKLAYGDRERYIADPDFEDVPVEMLVSKTYAESQRRRIRDDVALAWPFGETIRAYSDTTTFITADRDGNLLVATTSIGRVGLVAGKTGVVLNNRMRMFHEEPNHPNRVAPRKKVRITLNPMMVFKDGRPYLAIASPGSDVQSQAQIQAFLAIVEFGLDPQAAAEAPRWVSTAFPDTSLPHRVAGKLQLEDGFPETVRGNLAQRGHKIQVGRGQGMVAVMQSSIHGGWIAGADPRGEAYAIGW